MHVWTVPGVISTQTRHAGLGMPTVNAYHLSSQTSVCVRWYWCVWETAVILTVPCNDIVKHSKLSSNREFCIFILRLMELCCGKLHDLPRSYKGCGSEVPHLKVNTKLWWNMLTHWPLCYARVSLRVGVWTCADEAVKWLPM